MSERNQIQKKIIESIPENYSFYFHLIFPSSIVLILIILISYFLFSSGIPWLALIAAPITLFFLFGFEWLAHRYVLHKPQPGLKELYQKHEPMHHALYSTDRMFLESWRELYLILMPPYAIFLVVILVSPLFILLGLTLTWATAGVMLITCLLFFLLYEWTHLLYHLPSSWRITQFPWLKKLGQLHRKHHDPKNMRKYNFNVTIPVFDKILKTYLKN